MGLERGPARSRLFYINTSDTENVFLEALGVRHRSESEGYLDWNTTRMRLVAEKFDEHYSGGFRDFQRTCDPKYEDYGYPILRPAEKRYLVTVRAEPSCEQYLQEFAFRWHVLDADRISTSFVSSVD
jgi:hypothetical protein